MPNSLLKPLAIGIVAGFSPKLCHAQNMRMLVILPVIVGLLSSCANDPYANRPEGTVSETAPEGYETMMYGDIEYWYLYDHYYRYWPHYGWVVVRPPHDRPPYPKPPKPVHPIERPPGGKPPKPEQPIARPPAAKPPTAQPLPSPPPTIQPMPSYRPSAPAPRPMPRPTPAPRPMPRRSVR